MNLHEHLKIFEVLTAIAIMVGLTLLFGMVLSGLDFQTFDKVASALDVFDISEQWALTAEGMKFPFFAMGEFYDQFYKSFEHVVLIPAEDLAAVSDFFDKVLGYSEFMALAYSHGAVTEQKNYSGQILGAVIELNGKVAGQTFSTIPDATTGGLESSLSEIPRLDPTQLRSCEARRAIKSERAHQSLPRTRSGVRDGEYAVPNFQDLFANLKSLISSPRFSPQSDPASLLRSEASDRVGAGAGEAGNLSP